MKKGIVIIFLTLLVSNICFSQRNKDKDDDEKYTNIYIAANVNYYPPLETYSFPRSYIVDNQDPILEFLTPSSGTFEIEEGTSEINQVTRFEFTSYLLNVGASVQIRNSYSIYHEFALSRLTHSKFQYDDFVEVIKSNGQIISYNRGAEQRSTIASLRYEFGKYFGHPKKSKIRFGIAGSIEPSFYSFYRNSNATVVFPFKVNIFSLNLSVIPIVSIKLGKKLSLDFKVIPSYLILEAGRTINTNPNIFVDKQEGIKSNRSNVISLAGSLQLRYRIKEPDNRSRRR